MKIYSSKGDYVGDFNPDTKTYTTQRDSKQGQVFYHFGNALAVDTFIIKNLLKLSCKNILILGVNLKEQSFFATTTLQHFLTNSTKISYGAHGEQRRLPLKEWTIAPDLKRANQLIAKRMENLSQYI